MKYLVAAFLMFATPALAQQPGYAPPDAELWGLLGKALDDIPMSMSAHQQVQLILANVQREAMIRAAAAEAAAKAAAEAKAKEEPKK